MANNAIVILEQILNQTGEMLNLTEMGEQIDAEYIEKLSGILQSMAEIHSEVFGDESDDSEEDEDEEDDSEDGEDSDNNEARESRQEAFNEKEGLMAFLEAKRGRPKKGSEEESNVEPISVQLQKRSNNASVSVQFHDGSKHEIPREHANKALSMLNSLKPGPRGDAHAAMSKSKQHFYNVLKGHSFAPVAKPRVSLGSMRKEEVEQVDEVSLKTKMSAYSQSKDGYSDRDQDRAERLRSAIVKKHGTEAGKHADAHADSQTYGREVRGRRKVSAQLTGHKNDKDTLSGGTNPHGILSTDKRTADGKIPKNTQRGMLNVLHNRKVSGPKGKLPEEVELDEKRGLWDNIHAKRKRIKAGSGEKMRKPGSPGAPTEQDFAAASESVEPVNELTKKTLASYMDKSQKDTKKPRIAGFAMAAAKHTPGLSDLILRNKKLKVPASDAYNEEVKLDEGFSISKHPVHGKILHKDGKPFLGSYDQADAHAAKHKGTLIKSLNPKKYMVKMPESKPAGNIEEKTKIAHVLDPNKTLKHAVKDAKANYDFDIDGDVDILDKKRMVPADSSGDKTKAYLKKYALEKKHTKGGVAYEQYDKSNLKESNLQIVNKAVEYIKSKKD